jgi:drug/metabolite transporter (DMT)-like permease
MKSDPSLPSLAQGRLCILGAAVLWSLGGAFTKVLREDTSLGLNEPLLPPMQIAACRAFFAGLALSLMLRRGDVSFRPLAGLAAMASSFALMNVAIVAAWSYGQSASAVLLQYTAPLWLYLASVWLLGERADRRGAISLGLGLVGIGVIVWGGWEGAQMLSVGLALTSGVAFAGVLLGLRLMRDVSSRWLTVVNHLFAALVLFPLWPWWPWPTFGQFLVLFLYGTVQMGLGYWLMARGLRSVGPQEAGTLTLLEPALNPLWAFLVSPATEQPSLFTVAGGACILGALLYRYWPFRRPGTPTATDPTLTPSAVVAPPRVS